MPNRAGRRLLILGVVVLLLVSAGFLAKRRIDRIERDHYLLAEAGQSAIRLFGELAQAIQQRDPERVAALYHPDFDSGGEAFWQEEEPTELDGVVTWTWSSLAPEKTLGQVDVPRLFSVSSEPFSAVEYAKVKLARVEELRSPSDMTVRGVLWLRGRRTDERLFEAKAKFLFDLVEHDGDLAIRRQKLLGGTTVAGPGEGFADVAQQAGLGEFRSRRNPAFSTDAWAPERMEIVKYASGGVSAADYDGDGWYDLFLANGGPIRLYRNRGDGTFEDATAAAGLPTDLDGVAVGLFADLDEDGDRDLFVGRMTAEHRLYRNEGDGTFSDVSSKTDLGPPLVTGASATDYDNDGDLDLYLQRYLDPRTELPITLFFTRNGESNSLLRNDGGFRFVDVAEAAGVDEPGLSLGSGWADYDGDGDQDLYVANDFGRNALLRNDGPGPYGEVTFTDISAESDAWDLGYGMSVTWADADADGDLDVYVSNVHSGQRWYGQAATLFQYLVTSVRQRTIFEDFPLYRELFSLLGADWRAAGDRVTKGNSLLLNDGRGGLEDVAEIADANPFGWYWGSTLFDYDNDGDLDIYAANGWITGETYDDL